MTRKSRVLLVIATVALPVFAACSASPTGPDTFKIRRDGGDSTGIDTTKAFCFDHNPWGRCAA